MTAGVGSRPGAQGPLNHRWRGDQVSYRAVHMRLHRQCGPASHHPCALCGQEARQWSYTYAEGEPWMRNPFSTDLTRYRPLCGPCHTAYDRARPGRPQQRGAVPLPQRAAAIARVRAGETQRAVAASLGITSAAISRWMVHARANQEG